MTEQTEQFNLTCDGHQLKSLANAGLHWLESHYRQVNELNVFPVPDGDTGTNMLLTMRNACNEVVLENSTSVGKVAQKIAYGAMMGSRGNSGTIMSQLWKGFAQSLGDTETFDAPQVVAALRMATDMAYRGVQRPVEGTILTVAREMTEEAEAQVATTPNLQELLEKMVTRGWASVENTPNLLPRLKEAGVVDSGGVGLVYILEGMLRHLKGQSVQIEGQAIPTDAELDHEEHNLAEVLDPGELGYGYDVQFVIKGEGLNPDVVKSAMESMGDSVVVVGNDTAVKVHVHVHNPGHPLHYGANLGVLLDVVVENMQVQYEEYLKKRTEQEKSFSVDDLELTAVEPSQIGVVAVVAGDGLAGVFQQLGVAGLVNGGQTNNPSTEEILKAIGKINTDKIIILPNNKNIILAAEQAAKLISDKQCVVVPTRSFTEGVSAMLPYQPDGNLTDVAAAMTKAKDNVFTGEVTTATRSVELDGVKVKEGQIIGLLNGKLRFSGDSVGDAVRGLLAAIDDLDNLELVTLYYGDSLHESEVQNLSDALADDYPNLEFETVYGGQPHYQVIFSVE
ncbi:MAG: DAK2 domain-containing protein [Chloroflexi bacterium]|nr:DAK2 domain-containing protein [Chloroflexota bacterium]